MLSSAKRLCYILNFILKTSLKWEERSVDDEGFKEILQVIKVNFLQGLLPFILQLPVNSIALYYADALYYAVNNISQNVHTILFIFEHLLYLSPIADPLIVITVIGSYRREAKKLFCGFSCKTVLYCGLFITIGLVISVFNILVFHFCMKVLIKE